MTTPITLAIDASTYIGTVAVWRGETRVAEGEALMRGVEEERLMPAVVATLAKGGAALRDVTRVVCGGGPGSFTSLRIAAAIAKRAVELANFLPHGHQLLLFRVQLRLRGVECVQERLHRRKPLRQPGQALALCLGSLHRADDADHRREDAHGRAALLLE